MDFLGFAAKVGIVAGAIKLSIDNDVWSLKTEKGSETYENLKKYILPGTIVYREKVILVLSLFTFI